MTSRSARQREARLSRLLAFAVEVGGGPKRARRFLREPHMLGDGEAPIDVALSGELGGQVVEEILGRLAYGSVV